MPSIDVVVTEGTELRLDGTAALQCKHIPKHILKHMSRHMSKHMSQHVHMKVAELGLDGTAALRCKDASKHMFKHMSQYIVAKWPEWGLDGHCSAALHEL